MEYHFSSVTPTTRATRTGRPSSWIQFWHPTDYQWKVVNLPVAGLPAELVGLRILHLTDLHFRPCWSPVYSEIIERINSANVDLILMTGDFVDDKINAGPSLRFANRFFSRLRSRLGNFTIFGNHDHDVLYRLARRAAEKGLISPEPWPRRRKESDNEPLGTSIPPRLPKIDLFVHSVLDDRRELIEYRGATIELIGFRGTSRNDFNSEFLRSLPGKQGGSVRIVLSHHPDSVRRLVRAADGPGTVRLSRVGEGDLSSQGLDADVILAGHTHGGQICLPSGRAIISHDSLPKECVSGVHRFGSTWLVVSRGLGFSSIPVRVFCRPEIIELRLVLG